MTQTQQPSVVAGLRLVRLVGRGGEGDVWEARSPDGARRAVKLVRPEAVAPPDQVQRRGDWLRRIDHPALVRVRRTGMLADPPWQGWGLVEMDFVDGTDLSAPQPRPDVLRRLRPLAEGLDQLHAGRWSQGTPLVHRDVKPANLIDATDGGIVLVDNSSLCGVDRTMLTRIGTPVFAAPEVLTGRIGPAADVYSFAATVVALRTGARGEALLAHIEAPHTLDAPRSLVLALDADPARRPASCALVLRREQIATADGWLPTHVVTTDAAPGQPAQNGGAPDTMPRQQVAFDRLAAGEVTPQEELPAVSGVAGADAAADVVPAPPPRAVWPFCVLLAGVATLLGGAALEPSTLGVPWVVTALAVSVVAHVAAERSVWGALVLPPVSWAVLLADRATTVVPRRDWLRSTVTGVLSAATLLGSEALRQAGPQDSGRLLVVTVVVAYLATIAAVTIARRGTGHAGVRVLLAPATVVGSVLLLVVAVLLVPVDAATGARPGLRRRAGAAVRAVGAVAAFGPAGAPLDAVGTDGHPDGAAASGARNEASVDAPDDGTTWRGARA